MAAGHERNKGPLFAVAREEWATWPCPRGREQLGYEWQLLHPLSSEKASMGKKAQTPAAAQHGKNFVPKLQKHLEMIPLGKPSTDLFSVEQ